MEKTPNSSGIVDEPSTTTSLAVCVACVCALLSVTSDVAGVVVRSFESKDGAVPDVYHAIGESPFKE